MATALPKAPHGPFADLRKAFIKEIEAAANRHFVVDVFGDAVHMMATALWRPVAPESRREEIEADFMRTREKYSDDEYAHVQNAFGIVIEALELRREEFLGNVLEEIGAANTHNGQFLTPNCVAKMMAKITYCGMEHKDGEIVTLNDPACGASVTLIAGAEEMLENGVPQKDIYIVAGDVDRRACDISYVEFSLLGYAAKVEHMDALSLKRYGEPRYTLGYFLHGMPMRLPAHRARQEEEEKKYAEQEAKLPAAGEKKPHTEPYKVDAAASNVQMTFDL